MNFLNAWPVAMQTPITRNWIRISLTKELMYNGRRTDAARGTNKLSRPRVAIRSTSIVIIEISAAVRIKCHVPRLEKNKSQIEVTREPTTKNLADPLLVLLLDRSFFCGD